MSSLTIPDLDDATYAWLERRARQHNRGLAEEAADALRSLVTPVPVRPPAENLVDLAARLFGPGNGLDLDLPPRSADRDRPLPASLRDEPG